MLLLSISSQWTEVQVHQSPSHTSALHLLPISHRQTLGACHVGSR